MNQPVFSTCTRCEKSILLGETYICLTRNREQAEWNEESQQEEIDILDSEEILCLCYNCGTSFNSELLQSLVKSIPSNILGN